MTTSMTAATVWRRFSGPVLVACALLLFAGTQVLTTFAPLRVRAATSAIQPSDGVAQVTTRASATAGLLSAPYALIARIRNDGTDAARFVVRVDGLPVCERVVGGSRTVRIDCAVSAPWHAAREHRIEVGGPADDSWALTYLELATHHGATRGFDLVVLPAGSSHYEGVSPAGLLLTALVLLAVFAVPRARLSRGVRRLHLAARVVAGALLVTVLLSGYLSAYSVVLSLETFWTVVLVLEAPRVWFAGVWLRGAPRSGARRVVACAATGGIVLVVYALVIQERVRADHEGNYSGLLHISRATFERHPQLAAHDGIGRSLRLMDHGGYDAQFSYYAVFDPFLWRYRERPATYGEFIDAPPYRYGRIGFSLLTRGLAGSRWWLYPAVMTGILLASLFVCGAVFAWLAGEYRATPAWGLLMLVIPGFWQSLQVGLPEPLAAGLLLGGFLLHLRGWFTTGAILFAMSLLVRETGTVLVVAVAASLWLSGRRGPAIRGLALAVLPLVVWRVYVGVMLAPEWGTQAFWWNAQNLGMPFGGLVELWRTLPQGAYYPATPELGRAALSLSVLLCVALVLAGTVAIRSRLPVAVAGAIYAMMAVSLTFHSIWAHVGNAQRGTYELFIVIALLTLQHADESRPLRFALLGFWAATALYTFFLAHDADFIRGVML